MALMSTVEKNLIKNKFTINLVQLSQFYYYFLNKCAVL